MMIWTIWRYRTTMKNNYILLALVITWANSVDSEDCRLSGYTAKCVLNILDEHIEATAVINHCHVPVDITFNIDFQYKNLTKNKWEYTFVTTNQNERVLIPGLLFPNVAHAPVFLYARVPEEEFLLHNDSIISIKASLVAELPNNWEEAEFLNHTIYIQDKSDCALKKPEENSFFPWIIGGVLLSTIVIAGVTGVCCWYNRHKVSLDELALVSSLGTGIPGSQPYQMGELDSRPNGPDINNTSQATKQTNAVQNAQDKQVEDGIHHKPGKKGFRFGRLKEEDPDEMRERAVAVCDKSVVIGNPILLRDKKSKKKSASNVIVNKSLNTEHRLDKHSNSNGECKVAVKHKNKELNNSSSQADKPDEESRETVRQTSSDSSSSSSTANSETKLPTSRDTKINDSCHHPLEDRLDDSQMASQGARPKLKRTQSNDNTASSINSDTPCSPSVQVSA